ncbi:MAG: aspartate--tRNA ligase [Candidatus Omnitrophica bacterium]|nr:aspartate--tRNA ligase [Candidatus Omnitrophota bacterium]
MSLMRTHTCGALGPQAIGQKVKLCGWVHRRRDHGGLTFIDLRDRFGLTQVVFNPAKGAGLHSQAKELRPEFCLRVEGEVSKRPPGTENPKLATGRVEVVATSLEILNPSATPPFEIAEDSEISEELRYTHRYLDLRRESSRAILFMRHKVLQVIRRVLDAEGFIEVETPVLTKSTPEGARDYLVPARLNPGKFYALPQSPQLFKQLLMVAGFDRYYQIAKCFRDEDLRSERQPEFTQLDLEMSFIDEEEIYALTERVFAAVWKEVLGETLAAPFSRLTYAESMRRFGTDKPDLRFGMELADLTPAFGETSFEQFRKVMESGGAVKGFVATGGAVLSGKALDALTDCAKQAGAKGLVTVRVGKGELICPMIKHLGEPALQEAVSLTQAKPGDLLLLVAGDEELAGSVLGALRAHLGEQLHLIPETGFSFAWITDFPLFRFNPELKRWDSEHHPFTAPHPEDLSILEKDPGKVRSRSYDLVVNGVELGSGSIRIHRREVQESVFRVLGLPAKEVEGRFGFLLNAFRYGAPPHGGIAPGIDRLVALMARASSIREVIAFPKTQRAVDLMTDAPSEVTEEQLKEAGISIRRR